MTLKVSGTAQLQQTELSLPGKSRFLPQEVLIGAYLSPGNIETSHRKNASPGNLNVSTTEASKRAGLDHFLLQNQNTQVGS